MGEKYCSRQSCMTSRGLAQVRVRPYPGICRASPYFSSSLGLEEGSSSSCPLCLRLIGTLLSVAVAVGG